MLVYVVTTAILATNTNPTIKKKFLHQKELPRLQLHKMLPLEVVIMPRVCTLARSTVFNTYPSSMLNRSGNTTDNLCFCYRFRDFFSRFRCCVYNGTGPLLRKHNGNMELHVSATFPFTDSCNFVLCMLPFLATVGRSMVCDCVTYRKPIK